MYQCKFCSKVYKYKSEKVRHELSHTEQFECNVCGKKFTFISALNRHEKQHNRTGRVQCKECGRSFRDEKLVQRHINYAHGGNFSCSKCKSTFHSAMALQNHMKIHRPESEREFRCDFDGCKKSFNFAHNLHNHKLTHTNTNIYFCDVCGKGFVQSNNLKNHLKTHDKSSKWLYCTIKGCSRKFTSTSARRRHMLQHSETHVGQAHKHFTKYQNNNEWSPNKGEMESKEDMTDLPIKASDPMTNLINKNVKDPVDNFLNDNDVESGVRTCEAVLGSCIVTENDKSNETCLCAKINDTEGQSTAIVATELPSISSDPNNMSNNVETRDIHRDVRYQIDEIFEPVGNDSTSKTGCIGCACNTCGFKDRQEIYNNSEDVEIPKIQYNSNGTLKVELTFDIEVREEPKLIPINSCKDIFGKCIVSGSGTIGEGCLCAKMMVDEQNANAAEIDELTPHPKHS